MLTKSKIFAFSVVALLALNGCGDRGADIGGSGAGGAGGGAGSHYPEGQDTDGDGLTDNIEDPNGNGIVDPGETDRLNPDTDGDGLLDGDPKEIVASNDGTTVAALRSCEPAQSAKYKGYDYHNKMWVIPDCDGDGHANGAEDNESLGDGHYLSDPYNGTDACFMFHDDKYCEVDSPDGRTWLDRDLGTPKDCAAMNDTTCYGALYQWGRGTSGHELRNNTSTQTNDPEYSDYKDGIVNDGLFINSKFEEGGVKHDWLLADGANGDENQPANRDTRRIFWSSDDKGMVCPLDFYVPTVNELNTTLNAFGITDSDSAWASKLKIVTAGYKDEDGNKIDSHSSRLWTTSYDDATTTVTSIRIKGDVSANDEWVAMGGSVRCVKKQ